MSMMGLEIVFSVAILPLIPGKNVTFNIHNHGVKIANAWETVLIATAKMLTATATLPMLSMIMMIVSVFLAIPMMEQVAVHQSQAVQLLLIVHRRHKHAPPSITFVMIAAVVYVLIQPVIPIIAVRAGMFV